MFVSFAITELSAFNLPIFMESRDPDNVAFYLLWGPLLYLEVN